jgi:hypothetical protein
MVDTRLDHKFSIVNPDALNSRPPGPTGRVERAGRDPVRRLQAST